MKIYKVSQDQAALQEVLEAMANVNTAIATINQSLELLESTGILNLFQRANLINAIQSGNVTALDVGNINQALSAMSNISRVIPIINSSLRNIQDNADVAQALKMDINSIESIMIKSLQTGDYQPFQSMLAGFKQNLPSISGTQTT